MEKKDKRDFDIAKYEPKEILKHFANLSKYPRVTYNHDQIAPYLYDFFKERSTNIKMDKAFNIVACKKATKGYENKPGICLQAHYDMVYDCYKEYAHNKDTDPIRPYVKDGWLKSEGTTLGADDGIGVAMIMEIFDNDEIEHGPIWAMLTADEEVGCIGANRMDKNMTTAKYLVSLDAGRIDNIYYGSGCGRGFASTIQIKYIPLKKTDVVYEISIESLMGGHSGLEIHKKRANAAVVLADFIQELSKTMHINIINIKVGIAPNAIPSSGKVVIAFDEKDAEDFVVQMEIMISKFNEAFANYEQSSIINYEQSKEVYTEKISNDDTKRILHSILLLPNGMIYYSPDFEASLLSGNIGMVSIKDNNYSIVWSTRALYNYDLDLNYQKALTAAKLIGFKKFEDVNVYSGWVPNKGKFYNTYKKLIEKNLGKEVKDFIATSVGLEVGAIIKNNKSIVEAISIGPDLEDTHVYGEKMDLKSLQALWKSVKELVSFYENTHN